MRRRAEPSPRAGQAIESAAQTAPPPGADKPADHSRSPAAYLWAALIARIYECLPLACPRCGAEMRLIAFLTEPTSVKPVLLHFGLPAEPPRVAPARGPPLDDIDQSPAFDLTDPAPVPEDEFDQTVSW